MVVYGTLPHSLGVYHKVPDPFPFKPTSPLSLGVPGSPGLDHVLCAFPPKVLPLIHEPNPSKSEISVFIIKQELELERQEVKHVGREGVIGLPCVKPLLTNYFKPLQDLEKPPQSLFWFC